jgi:hypothetical protein
MPLRKAAILRSAAIFDPAVVVSARLTVIIVGINLF